MESFSELSLSEADSTVASIAAQESSGSSSDHNNSRPCKRGFARKSTGGIKKRSSQRNDIGRACGVVARKSTGGRFRHMRLRQPQMPTEHLPVGSRRTARKRTGGVTRQVVPVLNGNGPEMSLAQAPRSEIEEPSSIANASDAMGQETQLARFTPVAKQGGGKRKTKKPMRVSEGEAAKLYDMISSDVIQSIRSAQSAQEMSIPRKNFLAIVKQVTLNVCSQLGIGDFKFNVASLGALQEGAEHYLVNLFADASLCTTHARRVVIMPKDLALALRLRRF